MSNKSDDSTNRTLLERLHNIEDREAREDFCGRYEPAVREYGLQLGLRSTDLDDVVQTVMLLSLIHI